MAGRFPYQNGKAVIVISHDRKFVDNITTRTIEVTMGRIYDYKVNYSKYLELRKDVYKRQVWYFGNGGAPKLFLGSPAWMRRNLYRRL